jgi:hypothetical protein
LFTELLAATSKANGLADPRPTEAVTVEVLDDEEADDGDDDDDESDDEGEDLVFVNNGGNFEPEVL